MPASIVRTALAASDSCARQQKVGSWIERPIESPAPCRHAPRSLVASTICARRDRHRGAGNRQRRGARAGRAARRRAPAPAGVKFLIDSMLLPAPPSTRGPWARRDDSGGAGRAQPSRQRARRTDRGRRSSDRHRERKRLRRGKRMPGAPRPEGVVADRVADNELGERARPLGRGKPAARQTGPLAGARISVAPQPQAKRAPWLSGHGSPNL